MCSRHQAFINLELGRIRGYWRPDSEVFRAYHDISTLDWTIFISFLKRKSLKCPKTKTCFLARKEAAGGGHALRACLLGSSRRLVATAAFVNKTCWLPFQWQVATGKSFSLGNLPTVLIHFQNHIKSRIGIYFISRMPRKKIWTGNLSRKEWKCHGQPGKGL